LLDLPIDEAFTNKAAYRQPDTIGAYGYLMLIGYEAFGELTYLSEAVKALNLYQSFESNPWYEIPSGAMACLAAAKLNRLGFSFDLNKIIQYALDADQGCLHLGKWGDSEVNGLMLGWRGYSRVEASNTAYSLESLILLPFLLPVVHYHPSFAKLVAKYTLHVAANMRLFFSDYMSEEAQSRPDLPPEVPYETLHIHKNDQQPFAFGDFHTHKSVYGGAFTLWWDRMVQLTDQPYILQLNLTLTGVQNSPPMYLYYNPFHEQKTVTLHLDLAIRDLFDVKENEWIQTNQLSIPPLDVRIVCLLPKQ
jgi:hypothetical protein